MSGETGPGGEVRVDVRLDRDTVWLTQRQMAEVFDTTPENVLMHLRDIFSSGELEADPTTKEFLVVRTEGCNRVRRTLEHYNLDAIVSVGYRVNSERGVRFRQWARNTLRNHLLRGFTLNERRLAERGLREARETLDLLPRILQNQALVDDTGQEILDLIAGYTDTWCRKRIRREGADDPADRQLARGSRMMVRQGQRQARVAMSTYPDDGTLVSGRYSPMMASGNCPAPSGGHAGTPGTTVDPSPRISSDCTSGKKVVGSLQLKLGRQCCGDFEL